MTVSNLFGQNLDTQKVMNGDFYNWGSPLPDNWLNDTVAVTKDIAVYFIGVQSLKISTPSTGRMYQDILNVGVLHNTTQRLLAWVKALDAGKVRIALQDSDGTTYSAYHTGSGQWELLEVIRAIATPVAMQIQLWVENISLANFDLVKMSLWNVDEGFYIDGLSEGDVEIESEIGAFPQQAWYIMKEDSEFVIVAEAEELIEYTKFIDLLPLVPEKFHRRNV